MAPILFRKWTRLSLTDCLIGSAFYFCSNRLSGYWSWRSQVHNGYSAFVWVKWNFSNRESEASIIWGDAMPHEMNKFIKLFSSNTSGFKIKCTISDPASVFFFFFFSQSKKATHVYLRLVYSCNCTVKFKSSLRTGTWLYINDLFAKVKVFSLQRFISLVEINISRLLKNSIFILIRNSC